MGVLLRQFLSDHGVSSAPSTSTVAPGLSTVASSVCAKRALAKAFRFTTPEYGKLNPAESAAVALALEGAAHYKLFQNPP